MQTATKRILDDLFVFFFETVTMNDELSQLNNPKVIIQGKHGLKSLKLLDIGHEEGNLLPKAIAHCWGLRQFSSPTLYPQPENINDT